MASYTLQPLNDNVISFFPVAVLIGAAESILYSALDLYKSSTTNLYCVRVNLTVDVSGTVRASATLLI